MADLMKNDPDKYPARMGQIWTDDETLKLLQAVRNKESFDQIASSHERTVGAIRARLRSLACDYYFNENRPIEVIMKFTGLEKQTIIDAISKRQVEMNKKQKEKEEIKILDENIKQKETQPIKEVISNALLVEIRDLLKELVVIMRHN